MRFRFIPPDPTLPDGFAKEGEVALTVNAVYRDGMILPSPSVPGEGDGLPEGNRRQLCTHRIPGFLNTIFADENEGEGTVTITYVPSDTSIRSDTPHPSLPATVATISDDVTEATPIGNMVVLVTRGGIRYLVWNGGGYTLLASRPPGIPLRFGMWKAGLLGDRTYIEVERGCVPVFDGPSRESSLSDTSGAGEGWVPDSTRYPPSRTALTELAGLLYDHLDRAVNRLVIPNGYVWQPFFIRYAYRLFDGSHCAHSQPILMTPVSIVPQILLSEVSEGKDGDHRRVAATLQVPYFRLTAHLLPTPSLGELTKWREVVAGVDIFASSPIPTYSKGGGLPSVPYCGERQFYASSVPGARRSPLPGPGLQESVFVGRYSESSGQPYCDHSVDLSSLTDERVYWALPVNPEFDRMVVETDKFSFVAHIPIGQLTDLRQPADLPLFLPFLSGGGAVGTSEEGTTLTDDWKSGWDIVPSSSCRLNGRLVLGGIAMKLPQPFPLPDYDGPADSENTDSVDSQPEDTGSSADGGDGSSETVVTVSSRANGIRSERSVVYRSPCSPLSESFPRYLYYPDRSADFLIVGRSGEGRYRLPLTPHPRLNGSFFYGGLATSNRLAERYRDGEDRDGECEGEAPEPGSPGAAPLIPYDSLILVSDEANPLVFPQESSVNIVDGPVRSFCPVTGEGFQSQTAVSQLYAFSNEGIWTLGLSPGGRTLLSRRISLPFVVGDTFKAVAVPKGAVISCDGRLLRLDDNRLRPLPHPPWTLLKESGIMGPEDEETANLTAYDPVNGEVVFSLPATGDRLVFSLSNSLWGFRQRDRGDPGIVLRPLRLSSEGRPSRLRDVWVEGRIPPGSRITVGIHGSDDLARWRLIARGSSPVRSLLGSPARFYRISLTFPSSECLSIQGLSIFP